MFGLNHSFFVRRGLEEQEAANCAASAREALIRATLSRVYLSECSKRVSDRNVCVSCPMTERTDGPCVSAAFGTEGYGSTAH
ncbi:hypothetical protein [Stakelama pacifica]|uniref:Uncharacterized protein n=1 Tax=Stakelama pacifica TaxID=517720 RepID=A0A4R6FQ20_9SPHN|nr:hypothetical protein [Stakelama pacifica]TDN83723.1 hypothetical protein EV664_104209 [Stakelama pacifica]GGO94636.1 hypothetical protein GCM10011329_16980 [Stakelama pacifica]